MSQIQASKPKRYKEAAEALAEETAAAEEAIAALAPEAELVGAAAEPDNQKPRKNAKTKRTARQEGIKEMGGDKRADIKAGLKVRIVLKADQRTGKLTEGVVKDILTNSPTHPHGIKVRLMSGEVGRVKDIL